MNNPFSLFHLPYVTAVFLALLAILFPGALSPPIFGRIMDNGASGDTDPRFSYIQVERVLAAELPVVPGAKGFGMTTKAGRGGTVYRVTNLNESGEGSLKACVDQSGPRVCVFETSGAIKLVRDLRIRNPFITIAGQTAPSPGILIRGAGISVETNDVLIQHIRVRVGDAREGPDPDNRDAIVLLGDQKPVYNIVLDHISASWSVDELFSTWALPGKGVYDVTVMNSIWSEALDQSIHPKGEHSAGLMVGPNSKRVAMLNNLFAFNAWRNPLVRDDSTDVVIANNFIYRPRGARTDQIDFGSRGSQNIPLRASVVGNDFSPAPDARAKNTVSISSAAASSFKLYLKDNGGPQASASDPWAVAHLGGRTLSDIRANEPPIWVDGFEPMKSASVEGYVLAQAGARPADRDAVDKRIIESVRDRAGGVIDSQSDVGGWPDLVVNKRALSLPNDPNGISASGYTNLEVWLRDYARAVEGSGQAPSNNEPLNQQNEQPNNQPANSTGQANRQTSDQNPDPTATSTPSAANSPQATTIGGTNQIQNQNANQNRNNNPEPTSSPPISGGGGGSGNGSGGGGGGGGGIVQSAGNPQTPVSQTTQGNGPPLAATPMGTAANPAVVPATQSTASEAVQRSTVATNGNAPLRVRSAPGGTVVGSQHSGATGTVVAGPFNQNGYAWWQIDYDNGPDGYSAGEFLTLQNISSQNKTVSNIAQAGAANRERMTVKTGTNAPLRVRASPGGAIVGSQRNGATGTVIAGPFHQNGYTWWRLDYDSGPDGYSAGEFLMR